MKKLLACCLLMGLVSGSAQADGSHRTDSVSGLPMTAPVQTVHSAAELDAFLAAHPSSAISQLGAAQMKAFLGSLVFTPKGLGSYSERASASLGRAHEQKILQIFGLGARAGEPRGTRNLMQSSVAEWKPPRRPPNPRQGKMCVLFPGGTKGQCINGPGYRCSHLCD